MGRYKTVVTAGGFKWKDTETGNVTSYNPERVRAGKQKYGLTKKESDFAADRKARYQGRQEPERAAESDGKAEAFYAETTDGAAERDDGPKDWRTSNNSHAKQK